MNARKGGEVLDECGRYKRSYPDIIRILIGFIKYGEDDWRDAFINSSVVKLREAFCNAVYNLHTGNSEAKDKAKDEINELSSLADIISEYAFADCCQDTEARVMLLDVRRRISQELNASETDNSAEEDRMRL